MILNFFLLNYIIVSEIRVKGCKRFADVSGLYLFGLLCVLTLYHKRNRSCESVTCAFAAALSGSGTVVRRP